MTVIGEVPNILYVACIPMYIEIDVYIISGRFESLQLDTLAVKALEQETVD